MTALAEALLAAQRQAIGALSKAYVADHLDEDGLRVALVGIGCTDDVDTVYLTTALEVLKRYGAPAPKAAALEPQKDAGNEPASDAQRRFLAKLADERGTTAPDYPLTKATASKAIEELKAGTYNADNYSVPF